MNISNITNYKPKDFAELLGVSVKTLQRWDREGILKANRSPTDRRCYTYERYLQFKGINTENDNRQIVIYARVSTRNQKDDLQNQVTFLRQFCNAKGIIVDQCIEDYGSGLNYNRKKWNQLLDEVMEQKIKTIIVTHKDRFIRFGYDWFEKFCMKFHTTIPSVDKSTHAWTGRNFNACFVLVLDLRPVSFRPAALPAPKFRAARFQGSLQRKYLPLREANERGVVVLR